jgi:hypothetical protein
MARRRIGWSLIAVAAAAFTYAAVPRAADLRGFDAAGMARLETAMWRDYYDKHYPRLFYHLYDQSRTQFGFSPLARVRIALAAARAAKAFQPTHSRTDACGRAAGSCRLLSFAGGRGAGDVQRRGCGQSRARLVAGAARIGWPRRLRPHHRTRGRAHLWRAGQGRGDTRLWRRPGRGYGVSRYPRRRNYRAGLVNHRGAIARGLPAAQACNWPTGMNAGEPDVKEKPRTWPGLLFLDDADRSLRDSPQYLATTGPAQLKR